MGMTTSALNVENSSNPNPKTIGIIGNGFVGSAVANGFQGKGFGSNIINTLEGVALEKGIERIILQARENALQFYKNNGYEIVKKSYILFLGIGNPYISSKITIGIL